jgi:hypothetical protein
VGVNRSEPEESDVKKRDCNELHTLPLYPVSNGSCIIQPGAENIVETIGETHQREDEIFAMLPTPDIDQEMVETSIK